MLEQLMGLLMYIDFGAIGQIFEFIAPPGTYL